MLANLLGWIFPKAGPQTYEAQQVLAAVAAAIHDEGSVELNSHLDLDARAAFLADGHVEHIVEAQDGLSALAGFEAQAVRGKGTTISRVAYMERRHATTVSMKKVRGNVAGMAPDES